MKVFDVTIAFLEFPDKGNVEVFHEGATGTWSDGDFFVVEIGEGHEVSYPVDNIFSIEEKEYEYTAFDEAPLWQPGMEAVSGI